MQLKGMLCHHMNIDFVIHVPLQYSMQNYAELCFRKDVPSAGKRGAETGVVPYLCLLGCQWCIERGEGSDYALYLDQHHLTSLPTNYFFSFSVIMLGNT